MLFLLPLLGFPAGAHEFWLLPTRFYLTPGDKINLRVFVGENFMGERWTGKSSRLTRFVHYAATDTVDMTTAATRDDTLRTDVEFREAGTHLVSFATNNSFIELDGAKFTAYLREEGLDQVLAQRQQRGEADKPARELYRRCAKTLVQVGRSQPSDQVFACVAGLPLELVPEQNPYALKPGSALTVRLLTDGQPLAGALVQVWQRSPGKKTKIFKLHTNQNGRVLFRLSQPGTYMVSSVRMSPASDRQQADWQSTWSTFTFAFAGTAGH
ncbi:DUF4198 domain-containing protein [Hymenobacter translucens]|uniref:DUF4198 domain-containing protein n=1 Tax=Hymenobacter translucens TaxID=2886507 RepID=UPI001D0E5909|nr:DUF4198 domain-containing protein [Hymenobacter translucens]